MTKLRLLYDVQTYRMNINVINISEKIDMRISSLSEALCAYDVQCDSIQQQWLEPIPDVSKTDFINSRTGH